MWWGGTKPDDGEDLSSPRVVEPEVSSEGSGSPPIDLMAEEEDEATRTIGADQVLDFSQFCIGNSFCEFL